MIKIAITGGIGSGKSYISHLLETMDVPVYNADNEAKRLMVSVREFVGSLLLYWEKRSMIKKEL